jgi:protein-tyrosine phosphatase
MSMIKTAVEERSITLVGCGNFRDLGGYTTRDGRSTRWRRLFRSDALVWLTTEDVDSLAAHGLKLAAGIDLRTHDEVKTLGDGPVYKNGTMHHHLPFFPTFGEDRERMRQMAYAIGQVASDGYLEMLEMSRSCFEGLFEFLGDEAHYPSAFYCAAGKDRTGMVSAILLRALGMSDDQIIEDYAMTVAPSEERFRERFKILGREGDPLPDREGMNAHPETMEHFLAGFDRLHGSVEEFLLSCHVPESSIERVRQNLLED